MTPETTRALDACIPQDARVLVTPTSFGKLNPSLKARLESAVREVVYNPFDRPLRSAELIPLIGEADGYIAGLDEIDTEAIEAAERLRVIARYGVGADRIDLAAATRRGILVTNTPGANAIAVAELTIGLILSLSRQICPADQATRLGGWPRTHRDRLVRQDRRIDRSGSDRQSGRRPVSWVWLHAAGERSKR